MLFKHNTSFQTWSWFLSYYSFGCGVVDGHEGSFLVVGTRFGASRSCRERFALAFPIRNCCRRRPFAKPPLQGGIDCTRKEGVGVRSRRVAISWSWKAGDETNDVGWSGRLSDSFCGEQVPRNFCLEYKGSCWRKEINNTKVEGNQARLFEHLQLIGRGWVRIKFNKRDL